MNATPLRIGTHETLPGDIRAVSAQYLAHKTARGLRPNSVRAYAADLAHLQRFLGRHDVTLLQLISERLLERWIDHQLISEQIGARSAARRLSVAKGLLAWARRDGIIAHDPAAQLLVRFRTEAVIAPERAALLRVIESIPADTHQGVRDRALFRLIFDAALRASEPLGLDVPGEGVACTVDIERGIVHVTGKGGTRQAVAVDSTTTRAVERWLNVRALFAPDAGPALFCTRRGERMSRQNLHALCRRYGARAGVPGLHVHLFRHRRLGDVVERLGVQDAQHHARHRQASTTLNVYGHHAAEVVRQRIRSQCPLGGSDNV